MLLTNLPKVETPLINKFMEIKLYINYNINKYIKLEFTRWIITNNKYLNIINLQKEIKLNFSLKQKPAVDSQIIKF